MSWQLRATAGPLEGAVYRIRRRVTLGRAGDCDVQIINDGVSRKHAKVVLGGEGTVLVDLGSNNGTYVGDERIDRRTLLEGDEFRIMRSRFVYEEAPDLDESASDSGVWAVRVTNCRTLRQTVDHLVRAPHEPVPRGETQDDIEARGRAVARVGPRPPERHRLTAMRPDGNLYGGDLAGDILAFHELQLRMTRGDSFAPVDHERLARFQRAFRQPEDDPDPYAALRRFLRFRCRFPARVRWLAGNDEKTESVLVRDLGVGGAGLAWREHRMRQGAVAWLVIDVMAGRRSRTLVFPTRVAWTSDIELGLQFSGTT